MFIDFASQIRPYEEYLRKLEHHLFQPQHALKRKKIDFKILF